jgi:Mg-chelatase subunit ChlI
VLEAARTHAAWEGRKTIRQQDILIAAELAFAHRMRRQPFAEPGVAGGKGYLQAVLQQISQEADTQSENKQPQGGKKKTTI